MLVVNEWPDVFLDSVTINQSIIKC